MSQDDLRAFLDLSTWDEHTGISHQSGPQCPTCDRVLTPRHVRKLSIGPYACPHCTGLFRCVVYCMADMTVFTTFPCKCAWSIVQAETTPGELVIRDNSERLGGKTVTNAVEEVLAELCFFALLWDGRKLTYYDSLGARDEITHRAGKFLVFRPGAQRSEGGAS